MQSKCMMLHAGNQLGDEIARFVLIMHSGTTEAMIGLINSLKYISGYISNEDVLASCGKFVGCRYTFVSKKFFKTLMSAKVISGMAGPLAILAATNELVNTNIVRV